MMQHSSQLLMIEPVNFGFNEQTAVNNSFQKRTGLNLQQQALQEFNQFVTELRRHKIEVTVIKDTPSPRTPDSIFPNNWISFHEDGRVFLYPMFAINRRAERKQHVLGAVKSQFLVSEIVDLSAAEQVDQFLEGTGSMVLDRDNKIAYACISPRTNEKTLAEFCLQAGYSPLSFTAVDSFGHQIYHTNVMMCIADRYAVVCLDSIVSIPERTALVTSIEGTRKEIISISQEQLNCFAGNMLQVADTAGQTYLVMSSKAYNSLSVEQVRELRKFDPIIHSPLDTIESAGGGSARCMIAEVFLART